ncbi:MAG TPA: LamG-like jellyroll fold domain-containing protein [Haliangium sp.]|nr:LamG-like jellyroll fold domain-containing protein [Haliangium sp.]
MKTSTRALLPMVFAATCALSGCEWIAGIQDTTVSADGGPEPIPPDSSLPDANPNLPPDASVPLGCPEPCLADAVQDFAYSPDAVSTPWLYAEETPSPLGATYTEMILETRGDGTQAYVGSLGSPAIVHCPSHPTYASCVDVEDKLLLETTEPGAYHPTLVWTPSASEDTIYRVSGDWRIPSSAPIDVPVTLLLARNSQFDSVLDERFFTRTLPAAFDFEIDVQPGDILRLIAIAGDASRAPLALSFYVSGTESSSTCQMATRFEVAPDPPLQFTNLCASSAFKDNSDGAEACPNPAPLCPATTETFSPGVPGNTRAFVEGASMQYLGAPNDYSGDWTVQLWTYLDSEGSWTTETVLADHDCETEDGIGVARRSYGDGTSEMFVDAFYPDPEFNRCENGPQVSLTTAVTDDAWHFIRITRSVDSGTLSLCVDGVYAGHKSVPADADMSATESMWLGRNVVYNPAYFRGRLANLRVFNAALPCPNR